MHNGLKQQTKYHAPMVTLTPKQKLITTSQEIVVDLSNLRAPLHQNFSTVWYDVNVNKLLNQLLNNTCILQRRNAM